jgi:hypothetical protein
MRRLVPLLLLAASVCTRGSAPVPPVEPAPAYASLVYATDTGLYVLPRDGAPGRIEAAGGSVRDVAVSADGRYAAWVARDRDAFVLGVHDTVGGRSRTWTSPDVDSDAVGVAHAAFVTVDSTTARLLRFEPEAILNGAEPVATPLRGVEYPRLIVASAGRVLVAVDESAHGGETVYDVAADGTMTRLFTDDDPPLPRRGVRRMPIGYAALTTDGRLVYGTGLRGTGNDDECTLDYGAAVRDLTTGRPVPTAAVPSLGGDVFTLVHSVTTGADGRTVVGLGTEMQSCGGQPLRANAYTVDGGRWTLVAKGAHWAATGPDGSLATISAEGVLAVGTRRVAEGVRIAVWSPV